jgi:hypothetical protein
LLVEVEVVEELGADVGHSRRSSLAPADEEGNLPIIARTDDDVPPQGPDSPAGAEAGSSTPVSTGSAACALQKRASRSDESLAMRRQGLAANRIVNGDDEQEVPKPIHNVDVECVAGWPRLSA